METEYLPLSQYIEYSPDDMTLRATTFFDMARRRRSVRSFSNRPVPVNVIKACVSAAATAPSGANKQPWHFVIVRDSEIKRQIRQASENMERELYNKRASVEWINALAPLKTDANKSFLETAPCIIAVFAEKYEILSDGTKNMNYYVSESVGIAVGILITAIHHTGLVCLPYTPSPMRFLNTILKRPENERPFLLLVIGYPADSVKVPNLSKKTLDQISTFV